MPKKDPIELFISVDIEASGPIPGDFSLLSVGASVIDNETDTFYSEIAPISMNAVDEALKVNGFSLEHLAKIGRNPKDAMFEFAEWITSVSGEKKPIFVGFNASFDWSFVNWYFHHYLGRNPFGIGALDIKAYYMGKMACDWGKTTSNSLPAALIMNPDRPHNALSDAVTQGRLFKKIYQSHQTAQL